ncbi:MAG: ATP-binding cassette domain-containing protein [Microbacteriaceae bacterium]|nr:ATP-binding cassette domain-containing protein [Microbacteriaceae bacterium]
MIKLRDLSFSYLKPDGSPTAETPQLSRVNLDIQAGEFVLVCGPTGSGKSTFLKTLNGLAPSFTGGVLSGQLVIDGQDLTGEQPYDFASLVGYVNQQPEGSFVADTVIDEIVYGAEQLGLSRESIQERLDDLVEILDISDLLERSLDTLSGGQQQRVAIAAALIAGQKILLLDEPTSALDQKGATKVLRILKELAHEHGVTILLAEHRISRVIAEVDSMLVVHGDGSVTKGAVAEQFKDNRFAPPIVELGLSLGWNPLPIDAESASAMWQANPHSFVELESNRPTGPIVSVELLKVSYEDKVALEIPALSFYGNQITAVMGENGSGKTTLCWAVQGLGEIDAGSVEISSVASKELARQNRLDQVAMVPQRAADLLFLNSLTEEFAESDRFAGVSAGSTAKLFQQISGRVDTSIHPRDLSAGQQLALVLSIQMVKQAKVLILDEPTRGLDYAAKRALAKQLKALRSAERSIILATHDVEFVAMVADRVLVLKKGLLIEDKPVGEALSFTGSLASQISQITKTPGLISIEQVKR